MQKKFLSVICIVVALLIACLVFLVGCNTTPENEVPTDGGTPQTFTIQYTDNTGIHSIAVQSGKLYSISSIPEQQGYEFMGLYDAQIGGTQYVNAGGSALAAFTDNKNIVLYPQFRAKEYTLILDYQGAEVTGSRSMKVSYNSEIRELPLNLTLANKNFQGWYTEPNRKGKQIADQYGVLPENRKITEKLFDLSDPDGNIKLFAGFKGEEFNVAFYFTENGEPEEVQVEYGTRISEVQLETRVNGKAVITWSKKRNDTNKEQIFTGKVTSEMVLYAAEFAPVIDFDSDGGNEINSIIARAGDAISLPTPVRENYKFVGWKTASGSNFNATTMPIASVKLTAKWQAMILFETNGGTDVAYISEPQGTRITLPETEKAGYMFAGWYESNGTKYIATAMPSASVKLYAKYWKVEKMSKVLIDGTTSGIKVRNKTPNMDANRYDLDLTDIYNKGVRSVVLNVTYQSRHSNSSVANQYITYMSWYNEKTASDVYKLWSYSEQHSDTVYERYTRKATIQLSSRILYCCLYTNYEGYWSTDGSFWKDFYIEIEYPDTSTLY